MSWSTLAHWLRKRQGLYLHRASAAAPVTINFRPTVALMSFSAQYLAFDPTAVELGGTLDPATAGAAVALSGGNLRADFTGTGSVLASVSLYAPFANKFWEVEFLGAWTAAGAWADYGAGYNGNLFCGNEPPPASTIWNDATGQIEGSAGSTAVAALVPGDILGFVFDSAGAANNITYFRNGALVDQNLAGGGGAADMFPIITAV